MDRFAEWCRLLPPDLTTLGLDEHTGVILDFEKRTCRIIGVSSIHIVRECAPKVIPAGMEFQLSDLGQMLVPDPIESGIPPVVWEMVKNAIPEKIQEDVPPPDVIALAEERLLARSRKDWLAADALRKRIISLGWTVQDTPDGYNLAKS
jgi:hypothetical protein